MSSNSEGSKSSDEQFTNEAKKQSKKASKSKQKKAAKGKAGKKPKQKQKKQAKQPKKKKPSKSKDKNANIEKDTEVVREYMEKQNRPYSLINVFDNLHGSIKKPALQIILENLANEQFLTCKKFGTNKVYFLNQSRFNVDADELQKLGADLTQVRQQNATLQARHKQLIDQHRKLIALKTQKQLEQQIQNLKTEINRLTEKKQKLSNGLQSKIEEQVVIKAERQQEKLKKFLKKYRAIKKDAISTWCEILQKKPVEVMEIMGLDT